MYARTLSPSDLKRNPYLLGFRGKYILKEKPRPRFAYSVSSKQTYGPHWRVLVLASLKSSNTSLENWKINIKKKTEKVSFIQYSGSAQMCYFWASQDPHPASNPSYSSALLCRGLYFGLKTIFPPLFRRWFFSPSHQHVFFTHIAPFLPNFASGALVLWDLKIFQYYF
jgi:hypothetical protein